MTKPTPPILRRPRLAHWMFDRGIAQGEAALVLAVSDRQVRRYLLPFSDPQRQIPGEAVLARIVEWTAGQVTAADFYPPELATRAPAGDDQAAQP